MKTNRYITRDGYNLLEQELNQLWKEERPKVTRAVQHAAALGDRSENAEYIYGKKRLREIDKRVRFLSKRLDELQIVYPSAAQHGKVFFGAHVELIDELGTLLSYHIVGGDELMPNSNKISVNSPVAQALLGKALNDAVTVQTPSGQKLLEIVKIRYD